MPEITTNMPQNRFDRLHLMAPADTRLLYEELSMGPERFVRPSLLFDNTHVMSDMAPTRRIDEATGLPLSFVPNPNIPEIVETNVDRYADWDHQYPKVETKRGANPVLDLPYARYALMHLRLQWSTWKEHHDTWNKYDIVGPMQPATPQQLAATICFGLSGYIPEEGIVLTKSGPVYRRLTDDQRRNLVTTGQVMPQNTDYPIAYLRWFVMQQETGHIRQSSIDEFLGTRDLGRRMYLGCVLAAKMVERAVEPFDATYVALRQKNELSGLFIRKGKYVMNRQHPRDLLYASIIAKVGAQRVVQDLETVFRSDPQYSEETAA